MCEPDLRHGKDNRNGAVANGEKDAVAGGSIVATKLNEQLADNLTTNNETNSTEKSQLERRNTQMVCNARNAAMASANKDW